MLPGRRSGRWFPGGTQHVGTSLGFGVGIATGYATLGTVGFAERMDYAAIGSVANLASRLCARAEAGQILVSSRVAHQISDKWTTASVGEIPLKGFAKPAPVHEVLVQAPVPAD